MKAKPKQQWIMGVTQELQSMATVRRLQEKKQRIVRFRCLRYIPHCTRMNKPSLMKNTDEQICWAKREKRSGARNGPGIKGVRGYVTLAPVPSVDSPIADA